MKAHRLLIFVWLILMFCAPVAAEHWWWPEAEYDPAVPTPQSVLGHEIGSYLSEHHQMERYIHRLESASSRVKVLRIGESVQRRAMYLVIVSSPRNLDRLEEIRSSVERLADPRTVDAARVEEIIRDTPPIGWLNYANDGGETAAFETGILMAYHLAAGVDPLTLKILENVVVILNPAANPDSHQTFATWMKASTVGPRGTADPYAAEHHVPWFISSDGNHYLVDSNRDAFALTQPETQAVARALHHWKPQVWIDNHGEPNEYYFAPFSAPMNLNYPQDLRYWATEIGRNCARHFDRFGWTYVKDETYDLYYPGYWDSYPALNGAVSATYETNGGGWKNLAWEKPDGTIATLRGAIHGHFVANLATLETLADRPGDFLRYFHEFFRSGMAEVDGEEIKAFLFPPGGDPGRLSGLVELLLRHGVEVHRLETGFSAARAETYFDRRGTAMEFPVGTLVVPLRQPQKRLIKTLLEPDPRMEDIFLKSVAEAVERNRRLGTETPKEPLGFYDVTAWALPLTFGVEAAFITEEPSLAGSVPLGEAPRVEGKVEGAPARYAYLFSYETDAGARLAGRLLQEDYRVALATRPFRNSGVDFAAGTFVVRVERNPDSLHERIRELASECGAVVRGVDTAWGDEGITLGSRFVVDLNRPRIMVFTNEPTQATAFGGVHSLLEQRFGLEFTAARADYFAEIDLSRYNVIVLPDGSAAGYRRLLGDEEIRRLRHWIETGGVLVGIKAGAEFAAGEDVDLADVRVLTEVAGDAEVEVVGEPEPIPRHPGSIFRVDLNTDYYLGLGYPPQLAVQFRGNRVFTPSRRGTNVAVFSEGAHVQGQYWDETERILEGTAYLVDVPVGRGHVILFADDPTFRAYWRGLDRLFLSALLFAPSF